MGSSFIHLIRTDSNEFFLMADVTTLYSGYLWGVVLRRILSISDSVLILYKCLKIILSFYVSKTVVMNKFRLH